MKYCFVFFVLASLVASPDHSLSQTISPSPLVGDSTITLITSPAQPGDSIAILTDNIPGSCAAAGTSVPLLANTNNLVLAGAKTTVILQGPLSAGVRVCAVMKDGAGSITGTTPEVVVGTPVVPAISPVPRDGDSTITLSTAPAAPGDSIVIKTSKTAGTCAISGTSIPLLPNTSNLVLPGTTTTVAIQGSVSAGSYICAVMTNGAGSVTGTTSEVVVRAGLVPAISPVPREGDVTITLSTAPAAAGDTIAILTTTTAGSCAKAGTPVPLLANTSDSVLPGAKTTLMLENSALKSGNVICGVIKNAAGVVTGTTPEVVVGKPPAAKTTAGENYTCGFNWNDCDWQYWVLGGGEESALSSQDSLTNPFISLFVRAPSDNRNGSVWLLARFLGAANANNTNNVVAATQSAIGSSSTSGLPQVGTAVDYTIGFQHDWFLPSKDFPDKGGFTIGGIVAFGATTPLSAQHATAAFVVPAYGTNECNELLERFPSKKGPAGLPSQPSTPYITTTTTPSGGTPTTTMSGPFCIINPVETSTTTSSSTVTVSGIAQTDIAFAPEDRNSFLLKYMAGVRLINRWHNSGSAPCSTSAPCTRTVVDVTLGQDEAITGGMLRHFVGKTDAVFPIPGATSICFFGSAALRFSRNQYQSPLILQSATVVPSSATPPATISLPSTSTWVLPLTQPDRDFYRIGIGLDLTALLAKAFSSTGNH